MTNEEARAHMDMLIAHKDKALDTHPYFNRCDSCIHSEECDGSNCYECVKGMADNFEARQTDKCKDCYYNDGEAHAECVVCDKKAQPTDEDCISRSELLRHQHIIYVDDDGECYRAVYVKDIKAMPSVTPEIPKGHWIEDAKTYYEELKKRGLRVDEYTPYFSDDIACSECLAKYSVLDNETQFFKFCPNCGADMRGGGEDENNSGC